MNNLTIDSVDLASIDPLVLPAVDLGSRKKLPKLSAVYFAIDGLDRVQYVGRSVDLNARWVSHHRQGDLRRIGDIRIAWLQTQPDLLDAVEGQLIQHFNPPLNRSHQEVCINLPVSRKLYCRLGFLMLQKSTRLSQSALAEELGIALGTINKLYNGRPFDGRVDSGVVEKICNYFKCDIGDLFELQEESDSPG